MSTPVFVGRARELAALAEALAHPPAIALVEGEAGIGKSRLLQEFLAGPAAPATGLTVSADCPPLQEPYTLGPIVDAVRQAIDQVAGLGLSDLAGALRPLFPEWAADLPPAPAPTDDARAARHWLFRALTELLHRMNVTVPVVEDVHWADDTTLEFLLFVASRQPQPVSLVVTYRPEDVPADSLLLRLSSRLLGGTTYTRLSLGPLDLAQTADLVSSMLGGEPVSTQFAEFLQARTDGVPLAVEECVRLMHDRADLLRYRGGWARRDLADIEVPPTVRDAVVERIRRLSEDARAVLEAAAVLADPARERLLTAVSGLPADRSLTGLAEALDCGLLRDAGRGMVSFRHGLASRAVYEVIPVLRRRALHLRAGRALEEGAPRSAVRLASHFREAGDIDSWARHGERAADAAIAAGDWVAAASLLHQLLRHADLPATAVAPLAAKIPRGSLSGNSRVRDVAAELRTALESGTLDATGIAVTRYRLGMVLDSMYEHDAGRHEMELAIPDLPPTSIELLYATMYLGWPRGSTCTGRMHRAWLRRAATIAHVVPPAEQQVFTVRRAMALLLLDEPAGWEMLVSIPDEVSTPAGRRHAIYRDLNIADMSFRWGHIAQARRRFANAMALSEKDGHPSYDEHCRATLLVVDWFTGRWDGLADRAEKFSAAGEDMLSMNRLQGLLVIGLLRAKDGRLDEAETALTQVLTRMNELGAVESAVYPAAALSRLYLTSGRVEDALRITEEPIGVVALKETWLWATELAPARVDALIAAGRVDEAAELVTVFGRGVLDRDAPAPRAALTLCRGIRCAGRGEYARAAALFGRAAGAFDLLPFPFDALLARGRQARCLLAAGRREQGLPLLEEVFTALTDLGAPAAAATVLEELKDQGSDAAGPRQGRPGYGDRLSPREIEVVGLLAQGRTNRQIAEELTLSRQTVNSHVSSAMRKLRVPSRTALAVSAVELGFAHDERDE